MGGPPVRGTTTVNLDPSPTGFQELPKHLWNCSGIRFMSIPSRGSWLHTLQYVDDLLLTAANHQDCLKGTELLLHLLWGAGYKVSWKKTQICQDQVKYLGFHNSQGQQNLGAERKQAVCSIPTPTSRRQICEFLGATGFCWIWIPNFSLLAKPLYEATKRGWKGAPNLGIWPATAFYAIKKALVPLLWDSQM
jgi:hypothetical protein